MIIFTATGNSSSSSMEFMRMMEGASYLVIFVVALVFVARQYNAYRKYNKPRLGAMLNWIGLAIVAFSFLLNTAIGATLSFFLSEQLGLPYLLPSDVAALLFVGGLFVVLSGVLIGRMTRRIVKMVDDDDEMPVVKSTPVPSEVELVSD